MSNYVEFSPIRKALIVKLKAFLKDPANRPYKDPKYGTKYAKLFLADYALYAVLRGVDYRKVSHLEDGANAKLALESLRSHIQGVVKNPEDPAASTRIYGYARRYIQGELAVLEVLEINLLLEDVLK